MPALVGGPGPSAFRHTKSRWMILSQQPVEGRYLLLWLDGITSERLSNKADVPLHPVALTSSASDHSTKGAQAYAVSGMLGSPLAGDNVAPKRNLAAFAAAYDDLPVLIAPPPAVTKGLLNTNIYNDRGASLIFALERMLGIPVDVFSPQYGKLRSFIMTSYGDSRDGGSRIPVELSFQQLRRPSVETVVVPRIPRARNQSKPAQVGTAGVDEVPEGGELGDSNLYDIFGPRNPNSTNRSGRLSELSSKLPTSLSGGLFSSITGVE